MGESFFQPAGEDRWRATDATGSPWDPRLMHAGPPSALLARAVERLAVRTRENAVARVTVDILGPLPVGEVAVATRVLRGGRSVALVEALMESVAGGATRPILRASAWVHRLEDLPIPRPAYRPLPPVPATPYAPEWFPGTVGGYVHSMDLRMVSGDPAGLGPAEVWMRQCVPLVPDEAPSGLQRVMTVADSGNGISAVLDPREYLYVNTDLTVHLHRPPQGEWIYMAAETVADPSGIGLATSRLGDEAGDVGAGAQALHLARRAG